MDPTPSPTTVPPPEAAPAAPPAAPPPRVRLRWHPIWMVLGIMLILTVTLVGAGGLVRAPYVVFAPGSAIPTEPAISAPGTETYETDGAVLFLTVSLRGASRRMGYAEAVWGWLVGDQDVFPRDAILGGQTGEENREASVQEMALSQEVAAKVALEHLGYDVPAHGTGTIISDTIPDTPAADVLEPFDVITALDDVPTPTDAELRTELEGREPGDVVEVTFERDADGDMATTDDADEHTGDIELVSDPDDPERTLLGVVQVFTRDLTYELPFPVRIDTEDVGGPSAGLALTLGILDVLTPGSITGGKTIAVTGTIDPTGAVGEVGGVGQKAVAANREGAELLLVPAAEAELAERFADDGVRVVGVETLDDALQALDDLGGNALELADSGG
ncbi:MAG TPA: S16 family serine protease [Iamia sp.]